MVRPSLLMLCLPLLAGCDPAMMALPGSTPPTIAEQCVARAARALKVNRNTIVVEQALSVPEGDLVTLDMPDGSRIGCNADVDGKIGDLLQLGPKPAAPTPPA